MSSFICQLSQKLDCADCPLHCWWCSPCPPNFLVVPKGRDYWAGVLVLQAARTACLIVSWRVQLAAIDGHSLVPLIHRGLQDGDIPVFSFHLHLLAGNLEKRNFSSTTIAIVWLLWHADCSGNAREMLDSFPLSSSFQNNEVILLIFQRGPFQFLFLNYDFMNLCIFCVFLCSYSSSCCSTLASRNLLKLTPGSFWHGLCIS